MDTSIHFTLWLIEHNRAKNIRQLLTTDAVWTLENIQLVKELYKTYIKKYPDGLHGFSDLRVARALKGE